MLPESTPSAHGSASNRSWCHFVETDDIDIHAASQPEWTLRYEQLSSGEFRGSVRHVQLPGVRLVHETANVAVRQRGEIGRDHYGFALATELPGEAIFNGQRLDGNSIMLGRGNDLDLCSPSLFGMIGVVVSSELLQPLWERMYQKRLSAWLESQIVVRASPAAVHAVRELHMMAMDTLVHPLRDDTATLQLRDAVLIEWIEALPATIDTSERKTVAARKRVVDRACEMMLANCAEPLSILELCSRVGASPRKLGYCFQDVLGTSPAKYMRAVRLNNVRRELKAVRDARTGVQDVAARWGFWHLGQFSLDYKRQFGELPSATLRSARLT